MLTEPIEFRLQTTASKVGIETKNKTKNHQLLLKIIYDCPQNASGNKVLQVYDVFKKNYLTTFTQTRI